jgi:hypothetical protein
MNIYKKGEEDKRRLTEPLEIYALIKARDMHENNT